jgi:hypothetical protein
MSSTCAKEECEIELPVRHGRGRPSSLCNSCEAANRIEKKNASRTAARAEARRQADFSPAERKASVVWGDPLWKYVYDHVMKTNERTIEKTVRTWIEGHADLPSELRDSTAVLATVSVAIAELVHDLAGPEQGWNPRSTITVPKVRRAITNALSDERRSSPEFVRSQERLSDGTVKRPLKRVVSPSGSMEIDVGVEDDSSRISAEVFRKLQELQELQAGNEDRVIRSADLIHFVDSLGPSEWCAYLILIAPHTRRDLPGLFRYMVERCRGWNMSGWDVNTFVRFLARSRRDQDVGGWDVMGWDENAFRDQADFNAFVDAAREDPQEVMADYIHERLLETFTEDYPEDFILVWKTAQHHAEKTLESISQGIRELVAG